MNAAHAAENDHRIPPRLERVRVLANDRLAEGVDDPATSRLQRQKARAMFEWAEASGCRHQLLGRHFGEDVPPCGSSCDTCAPVRASLALVGAGPRAAKRRGRRPFG
jgi:superfamily II DNA helicase RecQ